MARQSVGQSLFGSKGNFVSNSQSMPIAFDNIEGNVQFLKVTGAVSHPKEGIDGITLVGCQPFADIGTAAADTNILIADTLATQASTHLIRISPDTLNGPLAAQANLHSKFVFRDVLIEYVSTVATTQAGALCMALDSDTDSANGPASFSENRQICPSIVFPFRHDRAYLHVHYDGDELYFTEIDTATVAGQRTTAQYVFSAWPSAAASGAITYGYTNIYYVIELYQSVKSRGFTIDCTKPERDLVMSVLDKVRGGRDDRPVSPAASDYIEMTPQGVGSKRPSLVVDRARRV